MNAERSALIRVARLGCLLALIPLGACEWFSDFKRQPHVVTWESLRPDSLVVRGSPQGSVPTTGTFQAEFQVSYVPGIAQLDSLGTIGNPTAPSEASLANGRKYFVINCAVCHGERADGQGLAVKYGVPAPSLMTDITKNRTDGYLYGMIRNGRGLMPTYNRIEEMDRWDVVNYLRALQGKVTGINYGIGPLAPPGVTGDKVPGPTRLGPTRSVPHVGAGARNMEAPAKPSADSTVRGVKRGTA
jgi:mono/diheme cytochrome c family protein